MKTTEVIAVKLSLLSALFRLGEPHERAEKESLNNYGSKLLTNCCFYLPAWWRRNYSHTFLFVSVRGICPRKGRRKSHEIPFLCVCVSEKLYVYNTKWVHFSDVIAILLTNIIYYKRGLVLDLPMDESCTWMDGCYSNTYLQQNLIIKITLRTTRIHTSLSKTPIIFYLFYCQWKKQFCFLIVDPLIC